jgi:agmatine/peptidylarginine deiminase
VPDVDRGGHGASWLRAAGITPFLPDERLMQAVGWNFNTYGYVRVQVAPKDYESAKELLSGERRLGRLTGTL